MKQPMARNHSKLLILVGLIVFSLSCTMPFLAKQGSSAISLPDGLTEDYSPSSTSVLSNSFTYSADQLSVQQERGNPTRFTILFSENIRQETWFYDTAGYAIVFRNGVKVSEKNITPEYHDEMYATTHSPDQFYNGMGLDEIVLSTGKNDFMLTNVDGMAANGRLMHLEGLSIGLLDGQVNFVETYPAMTERKLGIEDFSQTGDFAPEQTNNETTQEDIAPTISLTEEEAANQGTHKYLSVIYYDGDIIDERELVLVITFFEGRVIITENGENAYYNQVAPNEYFADYDESQTQLFFTIEGIIKYTKGKNADVEVLLSLLG